MSFQKFLDFAKSQWKTITIEPMMIFYSLGLSVLFGSAVSSNLLIWKVCHVQLNYTQDICDNLKNDSNKDILIQVQAYVNDFELYGRWINQVPSIIFAIVAGPISDVFGRKPLMLIPLFGKALKNVMSIINYFFIRELPLAFFYFENIDSFLGGFAVFYLGVYSFGTNVTTDGERAHRLARLDGIETLSFVVGGFLSPIIFDTLGYYGSYFISLGLFLLAFLHVAYYVKEPLVKRQASEVREKMTFPSFFKFAIVNPLRDMKHFLAKKRSPILKVLITLQFFSLCLYWTGFELRTLFYYFMQLKFQVTHAQFSHFNVVKHLTNTFFLLVVVPIFNVRFGLHDAMIVFIVMLQEGVAFVFSSFTTDLWQFYIFQLISAIGYCKFSVVRSLMSKCVNPDEVGRAFSIFAVLGALTPMAANPIFRKLYNATAQVYPGAVFSLAGGCYIIAAGFNLYVYFSRKHIVVIQDPPNQTEELQKNTNEMECNVSP